MKKAELPSRDLYDVTLGSPAIFPKGENAEREAQQGILRPVAFRLHLTMGLAFYGIGFELPTGKKRLSGAGHTQFEVFFHWVTS